MFTTKHIFVYTKTNKMSLVDIFSDSDFDKMFFNPYKVKGSLKKKYPKLKMFKTFQGSDDKLIKYVLYVYDYNTPLKEYYPDTIYE